MGVFQVELKRVVDDSYEIEIGFGLEEKLVSDLRNGLLGDRKKLALITDSNVKGLYGERLWEMLLEAGFQAELFVFEAGERQKTRETKARLEDELLAAGCRRDCGIIAVGGGVVTDLAGFLAGTFARGVPFVNYATTLLSAADASVGGKTAVDTPLATNLIGLFNQPKKVYLDVNAWRTLPKRQISSGLAETIKHACIASLGFFEYLEEHMEKLLACGRSACAHIAEENCRIKYQVVMRDERESGLREVLNLGHTVGRAIETVSGYELLHGEAVSIGLAAEAALAEKMGFLTEEERQRLLALLKRAGLPTRIPSKIDREALVQKLYTDKKVRNGRLRFVLQKGLGDVVEFSPGVFSTPVEEQTAREIIASLDYIAF